MRTLRGRLILSHSLPVLVVVPLIALIGYAILSTQGRLTQIESVLDREAQRLTEQTRLLDQIDDAQATVWTDPATASEFVAGFDLHFSTLTLLDARGSLLASTFPTATASLVAGLSTQQMNAILEGQTNIQLQVVDLSGAETVLILAPVLDATRRLAGIALMSQELSAIQQGVGRVNLLLLVMLAAFLVFGVLLGGYLALQLARLLQRVTVALHAIAMGQPTTQLPAQNVVEIDRLYQAVNILVQRLQSLEDARRHLLANLVHELGRPLGALRSAVRALRLGAVVDLTLREELLAGMEMQLENTQPLLDDLTRLHGQLLGTLELKRRLIVFGAWLQHESAVWRESARQKGITWQADIPLDLLEVEIDPDQMGRALGNLLSNAVKFTPQGGSIRIDAGTKVGEDPAQGDLAWVRVSDSGPGIPNEEQTSIFEPFHRSTSDRRFPQGMGLGLSIARNIARAHGGDIDVVSATGSGSSFVLTFPVTAVPLSVA